MDEWQLENCIKMFTNTFKRNYGVLSYDDVYDRFSPELGDAEIDRVLEVMRLRKILINNDEYYHLNVK